MQQFNENAQNPDDDAERQAVERLTQVCEQFRIALQASQPARIEDFLKLLPASLRAEALVRLLTIEDRHRSAQGKRLADGEVLARFSDSADREVVEKWLGQRSTQVFEETKVDPRANQGKRRPETPEKTYSADDFPNEDFDVFDELGAGAQGTVYRVFDKGLRINRAVKILKANPGRGRTFVSDQRNREGKILARLRETGAGVLTVHRMGVTRDGERYLVMDYCKKGSLHDWIEDQWDDDHERASLSWQDQAKLVAQLARTLALVHAEGLYHLDIKPRNILIGNDGGPLLADFAGSVEHLELFTGAGISFTEEYAAPEIHAARTGAELQVDGRTDLYSLGVVFYELLTGIVFTEDSARQRQRGDLSTPNPRPQPPRQLRPEIPEAIDRLCLDLLDSRFETRIRSATEVVDRLETILHRDANPPSPPAAIIKTVLLWSGWGLALVFATLLVGSSSENDGLKLDGKALFELHNNKMALSPLPGQFTEEAEIHYNDSGTEATIRSEGPALVKMFDAEPSPGESILRCAVRADNNARCGLFFALEGGRRFFALQFIPSTVDEQLQFTHHNNTWIANKDDRIVDARIAELEVTKDGFRSRAFDIPLEQPFSMSVPIATALVNPSGTFDVQLYFLNGELKSLFVNQFQLEVPQGVTLRLEGCCGLFIQSGSVSISRLETRFGVKP
jgi:serine/threonine protein kinase